MTAALNRAADAHPSPHERASRAFWEAGIDHRPWDDVPEVPKRRMRVRMALALSAAWTDPHDPEGWPTTSALVFDLADEVARLREAESGLWRDVEIYAAERDAARAALERVRAVVDTAEALSSPGRPYWTSHILNALEGES